MAQRPAAEAACSVEQVLKSFELNEEQLRAIKRLITEELELGLRDEDSATIKMLITYVRELSKGDENGLYLALDLGGTHFRVLLVQLGSAGPKISAAVHVIPAELLVTENGQELFDYIALKLLEFVKQYKLRQRRISLGFTFSFPCKQYGLTQSVLVKWCKGFKVGGVIGTDVVKQLKNALKRQLSGLVEAYIDVVAVINDTTGTLVACASAHKDCRAGLIVGTGFNVCYMEKLSRCEKWPANYTNPKRVIINCEWGAMGDHKERRELDRFRNEFDTIIDEQSVNPRNQTYEKMVAGMYVGEMLRLSMLKLYNNKLLFASESGQQPAAAAAAVAGSESGPSTGSVAAPSAGQSSPQQSPKSAASVGSTVSQDSRGHRLYTKDILSGKHLSMLAADELSPGGQLDNARKLMQELNIAQFTEQDLRIVVRLGSQIMHRSAHLVGAGISALLEHMRRPFTVIGYDGSLIKHHPYFLRAMTDRCQALTSKEFRFQLVESSDGSGLGAAVVAAALHKERRPVYVVKPGKLYEMHFARNASSSTATSAATGSSAPAPAPINRSQTN